MRSGGCRVRARRLIREHVRGAYRLAWRAPRHRCPHIGKLDTTLAGDALGGRRARHAAITGNGRGLSHTRRLRGGLLCGRGSPVRARRDCARRGSLCGQRDTGTRGRLQQQDRLADRDWLSSGSDDPQHRTSERRLNFQLYFVRLDLGKHVVLRDHVALVDVPADDYPFGHGHAQLGHRDGTLHNCPHQVC